MNHFSGVARTALFLICVHGVPAKGLAQGPVPGTAALVSPKDVVAEQLTQVRDYFQHRIVDARNIRDNRWKPDVTSVSAYEESLAPYRDRCRSMLGLAASSTRVDKARVETIAETPVCRIERITIPMDAGLSARGLMFSPGTTSGGRHKGRMGVPARREPTDGQEPRHRLAHATAHDSKSAGRHPVLIVCPDADRWPEAFSGLRGDGRPPAWLTELIDRGAAVYIPQSVERLQDHPYCKTTNGKDRRWILYRLGYVVGRTMPGLDVQDTLAAIDWLATRPDVDPNRIGIAGIGQGGMTALYTAAVDRRVAAVAVANYFQNRDRCWEEPVDRRLPGQLLSFGDAELAALVAPRPLHVVSSPDDLAPGGTVLAEVDRTARFYQTLELRDRLSVVKCTVAGGLEKPAVSAVAESLGLGKPNGKTIDWQVKVSDEKTAAIRNTHFGERLRYLRDLIGASEPKRQQRWGITARPVAEFKKTQKAMLDDYRQLVGHVPDAQIPLNPRTQLALITEKYKAYRVMLDVVDGVQVYGNLLVPRGIEGRVPAVICQHGLSGTPEMITGLDQTSDTPYHEFGRHLAERGYVVFAPLLLHHHPVKQVNDQVRQADAIGMMRIAMPIAKTERVIDFLKTLPEVDGDRIGYYGLSYGGYSAIWMAPLLDRLAAVVVSGHFNDWRTKITSDAKATSYLRHPDEDFYNWNVLNRFTHPELIAMVAPRPVCIEFGEHDGITTPEWTAYAWKQVAAIRDHLGLTDRVELAHYDGVHEIHGIQTFDFLDRFLRPERPVGRDYQYTLRGVDDTGASVMQLRGAPFVTHVLDASPGSRFGGRFRLPAGARKLRGMAVKLSRVGDPGSVEIRFGSRPGADDVGVATIDAAAVLPLFELWYKLILPGKRLDDSATVYYEVRCLTGNAPKDHYLVYGPKPIGGKDFSDRFGLSYRVLTDRPQDTVRPPGKEPRFETFRGMLGPYYVDDPSRRLGGETFQEEEIRIDGRWTIRFASGDEVLQTAADDLRRFLAMRAGIRLQTSEAGDRRKAYTVELSVGDGADIRKEISSDEGYRVEVRADRVLVSGRTARGVMRGVYWIEEMMRFRGGPTLSPGTTVRNCRFARRLTCTVIPGASKFTETSRPLLYTDGLLQRISHQGFNGLWIWLNVEEATLESDIFPQRNDPAAAVRFARLNDVVTRAKRFGIDVYCYFATNYHHPVSESFYEKHPDAKGIGWGNAMCSSNDQVRAYYAETVRGLFQHVPALKGLAVIFDSEGFFYCGNDGRSRSRCPRCKHKSCQELALQLLTTLHDAVRTGGANKELIVWPYSNASGRPESWVMKLLPQLPKDLIFQAGFSKGTVIEKDGIEHMTGDYNISTIGPPEQFVRLYDAARKAGLRVMAKTEHAISQEFIAVPYIPCLRQWYRRVEKLADYDLAGLWGNWCHYGYTPSPPAEILMWYCWTDAPPFDELLVQMARRDFGRAAADHVVSAWEHFTLGIQHFPYSDPVARTPGPLQKGPSQPLFLDPKIENVGPWRSWQNDLKWTRPWGPETTAKHLKLLETEFAAGIADLQQAGQCISDGASKQRLDRELGIARMIQASVHTILNMIEWIPIRDAYAVAPPGEPRDALRKQLVKIGRDELANARAIVAVVEADSRLGATSEGGGVQRGGLFTPSLIRYKIGLLEDVLDRQLAHAVSH